MVRREQIKILKIKSWQIKFSIDDRVYLLHETCEDYEPEVSLYRVYYDEFGRYKTLCLGKCIACFSVASIFHGFRRGQAYSHLDGYSLLYWLAQHGLSPELSPAEMNYFKRNGRKNELQNKLMQKLKEVEKIRVELESL